MIQSNYKLIIVRTIALLCIAIGLYYLIRSYRVHFTFFKYFYDPSFAFIWKETSSAIIAISNPVILFIRPIAGFGLVRLKTWGRNLTIGVLTADFLMRALSFYNFHTFAFRHPEMADKLAEIKEMIANDAVSSTQLHSIIPSYIIAFISLVSVIYLLKVDVKELQK